MESYIPQFIQIVLVLGVLGLGNILARLYHNVATLKVDFDKTKLKNGILKVIIIILIICSLAYSWIVLTQLGLITEELVDPFIICYVAVIFYFVKLANALIDIFGIKEFIKDRLN